MKPWREVLAERGWERDVARHAENREQWSIEGNDDVRWRLTMDREPMGWNPLVWRGPVLVFELDDYVDDTDELAFSALMAKPIGPGRVTVGALLGVSV